MSNMATYKEAIDLGFKKWQGSDKVFFDQYGFEYFGLSIELRNKVSIEWDCIDHTFNVYKDNNIEFRGVSLEMVKMLIKLLSKK